MRTAFGTSEGAEAAQLVTLTNGDGLSASITDLGATLVALEAPDRTGRCANVVLGFDSVEGYESRHNQYFGATIGRVANRIANAAFVVDGEHRQLAPNEPPHHLHGGGERSFDKVRWRIDGEEADVVELSYRSPDGEEGYPGRVEASATYRLTGDALVVEYRAVTDRTTPLNMTNHAYWNLRGAGAGTILDHELELLADAFTPTDDELIPTGAIADVAGTPLDFTTPQRIGARIGALLDKPTLGYDHNYVLRDGSHALRLAARLRDPASGRGLELLTDQPCLQLYSGNRLFAPIAGRHGATYVRNGGVCLEPQAHPDAVHQPHFPSILVEPGTTYRHRTRYRFTTA